MYEENIHVEAIEAPKFSGTREQFDAFMDNLDRPTEDVAKVVEEMNARSLRGQIYREVSSALSGFIRSMPDEERNSFQIGDVRAVGGFMVELVDIVMNREGERAHFRFRLREA